MALEKALNNDQSEIFKTEQHSRFTSRNFAGRREQYGIYGSTDGRGRVIANIFIERLWCTFTYEEV